MPRWLPVLIALTWAAPGLAQAQGADADTDAGVGAGADTDAGTDTDTDTGADTGTGTGTDAGTDAVTVTEPPPQLAPNAPPKPDPNRPPPKIATVVAGDPDETLRNTAAFIEDEMIATGLRRPTDPALRGAMLGETVSEQDGLERLRAFRRGLGLDPRKDLGVYKRIGLIAGADALIVVRREGSILVEVFDVSAAQFYEGVLDFDQSTPDTRTKFIGSRADQAQLRWTAAAPPPPEPAPKVDDPKQPADESRAKRRWKKAWPYVVVGVLLGAGVTYLIIDRRQPRGGGPPLLRFRPGDE